MRVDRKRARRGAFALVFVLGVLFPLVSSAPVGATGPYSLLISKSSDRATPVALDGTTQSGNIFVFTSQSSTADITKVEFWLDNPAATGTPRRSEANPPYDFNGGSATVATAFNTATIPDGPHSITAKITHTNATTATVTANFTVQNTTTTPALTYSPSSLSFSATAGDTSTPSKTTTLGTSDSSVASYSLATNQTWLSATPTPGTTPNTITVTADPTGLGAGTYTGTVTATATGYTTANLPVTFNIGSNGCLRETKRISPLQCNQIMVGLPYTLNFNGDAAGVLDKNDVGTGFTMIEPPTNGTGYIKNNLAVNTASPGTLDITTTAGIAGGTGNPNSQDNMLGVGLQPGKVIRMSTTLSNPPAGTLMNEQAGLWFGNDEDNYVKLVLISRSASSTTDVQLLMEQAGVQGSPVNKTITLPVTSLKLWLEADPTTQNVTGFYSINGGAAVTVGTVVAPPAFFTADAAGVDPTIGTNTFGGVFATHRTGASPLTYSFDSFTLEDITPTQPPPPETFNFNKIGIGGSITNPTSMAFGPDGKLYVTELLGTIHKLTLNSSHMVTNDTVITTLGTRLTLGIAIDPASTASNVIVWVAHSDPDLAGPSSTTGQGGPPPNSSKVTKLTGTNLDVKNDVITGLPRSQANHSINSLHFGTDGKLYIAQGGNTGAGAPNNSAASLGEFGWREEQPLSAAILVADVKNAAFDGTCDNTGLNPSDTHNGEDIYGANPCSVTTYATGLRNDYDFVFHSNGQMYSPENGAAVGPTYPSSPTPPCHGPSSVTNNPGTQNDFLYRVVQGKYYGHPDPHRLPTPQCVFKDGTVQGVLPLANYMPPIADLGPHKSADGIIEYTSNAIPALKGSLLISNYSQGDTLTRVKLSSDGLSVVSMQDLDTHTFSNPLPVVQGSDGTIYVGEFGGGSFAGRVSALIPTSGGGGGTVGTWSTKAPLPTAILDAGGAVVGGKLYFVAGKTSAAHLKTLYVYDPVANTWAAKASLPTAYPAVENPAVASFGGKVYVFGGQSGAFTGAKTNAAAYDPATNTWATIASMPAARGCATAQVIGTKIYVVGGFDAAGGSLATMSIYTPATNTWSAGASMATKRDNPGSAVLTQGGTSKLFVFGGRTRTSTGTTTNGTLKTVEMYNPTTNTWTARTSMPTGRRTMAVGNLNGKAQLMGGERTSTGGVFPQNEEYDPATDTWRSLTNMLTPRHGTVYGTIGSFVYVAGGGITGGSSFTTKNEAFTY